MRKTYTAVAGNEQTAVAAQRDTAVAAEERMVDDRQMLTRRWRRLKLRIPDVDADETAGAASATLPRTRKHIHGEGHHQATYTGPAWRGCPRFLWILKDVCENCHSRSAKGLTHGRGSSWRSTPNASKSNGREQFLQLVKGQRPNGRDFCGNCYSRSVKGLMHGRGSSWRSSPNTSFIRSSTAEFMNAWMN